MEFICLYIITTGAMIYILKNFLGLISYMRFKKTMRERLNFLIRLEKELENATKTKEKR